MKKLLTILFFFLSFAVRAAVILSSIPAWHNTAWVIGERNGKITAWLDHTICSGSGSCSLTSMSGYSIGDRALITAGSYSSGNFQNLQGIDFICKTTQVTFTGNISLGNDSACTWDGTGAGTTYGLESLGSSAGFTIVGHMAFDRFYNWEMSGVNLAISASSLVTTWDHSTPSTKLMRNCSFQNMYVTGSQMVLQTTFDAVTDFHNVFDSVAFLNLQVVNNQGDAVQIQGNGIYRLAILGGSITGNDPDASGDKGFVQIVGNCTISRFEQFGGYGYIARICGASLDGTIIDTYFILNLRLQTLRYGTLDWRTDGDFNGVNYNGVNGLVLSNLHALNNTSGDNTDTASAPYTAVQFIVGNFSPATVEFKNNLSFNTHRDASNPIYKLNFSSGTPDSSHNLYQVSAIGYLQDSLSCIPVAGNPINTGGVDESALYTTDAYNHPISGGYPIGLAQYYSAAIINALIFPSKVYLKQGP